MASRLRVAGRFFAGPTGILHTEQKVRAILASGLIAGEAILAVVLAILAGASVNL